LLPRAAHRNPKVIWVWSWLAIASAVALLVGLGMESCSAQRAARRGGRAACIERLADADACDKLTAEHHDACYGLTFAPGSRFRRSTFDASGYLECILTSPERFAAKQEEQAERRRHEREATRRELGY